ncbi:hypothetical protein T265_08268 [Opisthorchis viverrini]|uniref:Uncharacterized protein n=1 Tax=Opisthorchis viverrini TaxID=6198 RepID=A0A074ZE89_OPIVI|nr:hypothetical protein T265_08268 [Opisthorchis viverrini]KER23972.1 hypothetical protein T265_08268 [Opisthorchis viverrini]
MQVLTDDVIFQTRLKWLERKFTEGRLGQPGSIPTLVLPSGSMAARHRKGVTAERFFQTRKTNVVIAQISALLSTSSFFYEDGKTSAAEFAGSGFYTSLPSHCLTASGSRPLFTWLCGKNPPKVHPSSNRVTCLCPSCHPFQVTILRFCLLFSKNRFL